MIFDVLAPIIVAAFVGFVGGWVAGLFKGSEMSRAKHYQDCIRKLGFDPWTTQVGGFSGPIEPGDRFVLHPSDPDRRVVLTFEQESDWLRVVGGQPAIICTDEKGERWCGAESYLREHAARLP